VRDQVFQQHVLHVAGGLAVRVERAARRGRGHEREVRDLALRGRVVEHLGAAEVEVARVAVHPVEPEHPRVLAPGVALVLIALRQIDDVLALARLQILGLELHLLVGEVLEHDRAHVPVAPAPSSTTIIAAAALVAALSEQVGGQEAEHDREEENPPHQAPLVHEGWFEIGPLSRAESMRAVQRSRRRARGHFFL
jgi:hypothetical protein